MQWINDCDQQIKHGDIIQIISKWRHHSFIDSNSSLEQNMYINTALINAYGHFSEIQSSFQLFQKITPDKRNVVVVNSMMTALIHNRYIKKAIELYDEPQFELLKDDISHLLAIKACIMSNNFEKGKDIHLQTVNPSIIELTNMLIEFYGHFGDLDNALLLFNGIKMENMTVFSIGAMMKAFINNNDESRKALDLFHRFNSMKNYIMDALAIKACINTNDIKTGKSIHAQMDEENIDDLSVKTSLIEFYGHCADTNTALDIFHSISSHKRNSIVIGAIMKVLINNNQSSSALEFYKQFKYLHNDIIHNLALMACINLNDFKTGYQIHQNALISCTENMYID